MCQAGRKACRLSRDTPDKKSTFSREAKNNSSKMNELSGDVFENKGPLWKTQRLSRNVYKKTGS
jgi:hypothetical protein